ncbi:MAG: hypothetical protein KKA73_08705, partial [Chloroflexi bacterium]|nr:hypothetical protein [Chloroflexota bacterium]
MTRERLFRSPNGQRCLAGLIVLALLLSAGTPGFLQGDAGAPAAQAAPPAQDQAICKLLSSEMTDKRYSTNPGICPGAQEMCFGTFCPRAAGGGFTCEAYICRFQSAAEARQSIDLAISLGAAPIAIGDVGYETIVAGTVRSVVFARDRYAFSATVFDDRITSPFSQDQLRDLARKVDANIRGGAAPAQPPAGSLNVGIGGNYDEDQDQVSVTAGVENRPGVGIGDDYYEWSLDGASIHEGKEQKSLQYNTASLAAGEHVIVVKVTEKVNNVSGASGTATFKFTKKKAPTTAPPPVQPPAQPPAASAGAGTVEVTTPAGTTTVQPGGQASVQVPPGGQATVKLSCEELKQTYELLRLVWLDDEDMGLRAGHWQVLSLIAHLYEVRCGKVLGSSSNPRAVALAGNLAALRLAAEEWPVHLGVSVQEGPARFEVVHAAVALDVETATALVTSRGQNTFGVAHDPQTNVTYVAAYAGTVTVQPQNRALAPVTLQPGQRVLVTEEG